MFRFSTLSCFGDIPRISDEICHGNSQAEFVSMKAGKTNFRDAPQNVKEVLYVSDVHCIIKFSTAE